MNDFQVEFCKTPLVYEICRWFLFENSTARKEDLKTKLFFERESANHAPPQGNYLLSKCALSQISTYSFTLNEINSTSAKLHSPLEGI